MVVARQDEEIVCPKGTVCGRMLRSAGDWIAGQDFATTDAAAAAADDRYVCTCCGRAVAVREYLRWRVHLRRGWVR